MRTGMVAVNGLPSASKTSIFAPFGGYKQSEIGRELGLEALGFYTEIRNLVIDTEVGPVSSTRVLDLSVDEPWLSFPERPG